MRLGISVAALALVVSALPVRASADEPAAPASPSPPAEEPEDTTAARELYKQGLTHYHLGQFEDATRAFKKAYELSKKPGLLFNIAQSLRLSGHFADAAYFYRTYLRLVPDAPNRADVDEFIAESDKAARAADARAQEAEERARHEREGAGRAALAARRAHRLRIAAYITAGGGIALAGTGTFFAARAASAADDLTALADSGGAWSDDYARLLREGERDDTIGTSLIIGGGAAILTGAALYAWGLWQDAEAPARVVTTAGRGGAALWVGWDF